MNSLELVRLIGRVLRLLVTEHIFGSFVASAVRQDDT